MIWGLIWIAAAVLIARWRKRFPFLQPLNDFNWQLLVLVDIVAAFALFWPLYLAGVISDRPRNGQTISAICGAAALNGKGWGRWASSLIDGLFLALTSQHGHCLDAYRRWADPLSF